ncbi:hypothetical protein FF1_021433 [Malus domestica]
MEQMNHLELRQVSCPIRPSDLHSASLVTLSRVCSFPLQQCKACSHVPRLKIIVPELFFLPKLANHSAPRLIMVGETATVSTFVTVVGQPYKPALAGKGGFNLGFPCFPSRLSRSAVSSPQI